MPLFLDRACTVLLYSWLDSKRVKPMEAEKEWQLSYIRDKDLGGIKRCRVQWGEINISGIN